MNLKVAIIDDEPLARERLRTLLRGHREIDIVSECANASQALAAMTSEPLDLVFLDVQMPEMNGFDVLAVAEAQLASEQKRLPAVVFVTAYDRYALRAFEVHAMDYLLKPFDSERFERTLARLRTEITGRRAGELNRKLEALLASRQGKPQYLERLLVKSRGRVVFINADELDWIEAAGNYVSLHTGEKTHLLRDTMQRLESRLDPARFVRIHRSTIVQLDRIRELALSTKGDYQLTLKDGTQLSLSRTHLRKLQQHMRPQ